MTAQSREAATRDYRLVATGKPRGAKAVPRAEAEEMLREEMRQNHVRHDALELIKTVPPLAYPAAA